MNLFSVYRCRFLFVLLFLFHMTLLPCRAITATNTDRSVLVLNSYHPGYSWSDRECEAIQRVFAEYDSRLPVYVEYLDNKRHPEPALLDELSRFLARKYAQLPIRVLITCDNAAFDFALTYRATFAPQASMVFCGLNGYTPDLLQGSSNIVGIIETTWAKETIEAVISLCPWIKRLYVINDYTETGRASDRVLKSLESEYTPRLQFQYNENIPLAELLEDVSHLDDQTAILLDVYLVDANGAFYDPAETARKIREYSIAPLFNTSETTFEGGGIGGAMNLPQAQGEEAAKLAVHLLSGTPLDMLPQAAPGPFRLVFNARELDAFNLSAAHLPPRSSIINKPVTNYASQNPAFFFINFLISLLLVALVFFLLRNSIKRKKVERELARHREHLEHLVVERTQKLENARAWLEQRAGELKRANEYKSQFLAHISHEVRTPLNAIIGFAEIIMYSKSIDFIHQQSQTILNETEHLLSIINQLLDHARIESGKIELETKAFDLHQLLLSLMKSLRQHAIQKNLNLEFLYRDAPQYVVGDPLRIRQILLNLLTNAVKFTEAGGVKLQVQVIPGESAPALFRFSVTDTGVGIPTDRLQEIFKQFSQADRSTARKYGGTGLGTAIAYGLVQLMGGRLQVDSTVGAGSTFWFEIRLPVSKEMPPEKLAMLAPVHVNLSQFPVHKQAHILIADDYPSNQSVVRIHLQNAGYTCRIADNGREAVDICEVENFDLILMDISMPVLDGYEATRMIRSSHTQNAKIPILALSAHAGDHVRSQCIEAGMNDIIIKPIHRSSFLQQVDHWLTINEISPAPRIKARQPADPSLSANHIENLPPIDYKLAIHEFANREDLVVEALQHFMNDVRHLLPEMRKACQDLDADYVMKEAHKIAGAAGNLRAMPVAICSKQLEELCLSGRTNPGEVMNLLSKLIDAFEDLSEYLRQNQLLPH